MKILIFTEGTILMHKNASGRTREEIVKQVKEKEESVRDYSGYIPVGNAVEKIQEWQNRGVEIFYLTSRKKPEEIKDIQNVLKKYNFPEGTLLFRKGDEEYKDVVERVIPDILIEDDCESIGGEREMIYHNIKPEIKSKIKLIEIREFGGINHLPDDIL